MSTYCVRVDIENTYGATNVSKWADLNNNGVAAEITARIAWAIGVASQEVDDYLRAAKYKIPLANAAGDVPTSIVDITATLAGVRLYESRGVVDLEQGQAVHQLAWARQLVKQAFADILSNVRRIDAEVF